MALNGYTKLSSSILASTIWREPSSTRIVWITLLALADADGIVSASIPGLADIARVTLQECEQALQSLQSPDPYSRTKDHDGRRIAEVDGGWLLLNHARYRSSNGTPLKDGHPLILSKKAQRNEDGSVSYVTVTAPGYVYYAVAGSRVKIGFSRNPWARVHEFKTSNPDIEIVACEKSNYAREQELHQRFSEFRVAGEWFDLKGDLAAHVEQLRTTSTNKRSQLRPTTSQQAEAEAEASVLRKEHVEHCGADAPAGGLVDVKPQKKKRKTTHRGHVSGYCDWMCLPTRLRDQFVATSGEDTSTDAARAAVEARVLTWAARVREKWQGRAIGESCWNFWVQRWRERVGSTPVLAPTRHTTMPHAPSIELTPERIERLRLIREQVASEYRGEPS